MRFEPHWAVLAAYLSSLLPLSASGSSQLRAGWGDEATPRLIADQVVARYRDRKTNRTHLLVGADTEVDATSRSSAKPVFEGDVLTNFDNMVRQAPSLASELGV